MKVALYARVSTDDKNQDPETQLFALRDFCKRSEWDIYKEYVDRARAKDYKRRTAWVELCDDAKQRMFKAVVVFRLDRAFRSVNDCSNQTAFWHDIGIGFKSLREDVIDTTTSQGKFILHIMSAVAELESSIMSDRVKAGIARTMAQGNRYGRKNITDKRGITPVHMAEVLANKGSVRAAAGYLKCSRSTITRTLGPETVKKILQGVQKDSLKTTLENSVKTGMS